jgi:hypothetical protein
MVDLDVVVVRAREFQTFADGLDESGMHDSARRLRLAVYDVYELVDELLSERSARVAMQANYERALDVLSVRACETCSARARSAVEEEVG